MFPNRPVSRAYPPGRCSEATNIQPRPPGNTVAIKDLPVAAQYVWSPHYVDELILIDRDFNADGDLSDDGERLYVQQDANYNVTSVVGDTLSSGEGSEGNQWGVVERYQYDPYGRREVLNADWSLDTLLGADGTTGDDAASAGNTSDVGMLHGHQGGQHDVESHLVHFRNRDLNVVLGRWTRQDPLGYVDGGSLYEYVRGGPVDGLDPSGLAHRKGKSESSRNVHEEGEARQARDRGGEKGDERRRPPRKRPEVHKGPWPRKCTGMADARLVRGMAGVFGAVIIGVELGVWIYENDALGLNGPASCGFTDQPDPDDPHVAYSINMYPPFDSANEDDRPNQGVMP